MRCSTLFIEKLILIVLMVPGIPRDAYAYLDLGTGSYFIQFILPIFFGAAFAVKLLWKKIRLFFNNLLMKKRDV